jgi:hypothetical protein
LVFPARERTRSGASGVIRPRDSTILYGIPPPFPQDFQKFPKIANCLRTRAHQRAPGAIARQPHRVWLPEHAATVEPEPDPKKKRKLLPRLRFHDLRHSAATLLLAQGVHPRYIMELLGHSSISLTKNTYGHILEEMKRETARQTDAVFNLDVQSAPTEVHSSLHQAGRRWFGPWNPAFRGEFDEGRRFHLGSGRRWPCSAHVKSHAAREAHLACGRLRLCSGDIRKRN